MSSFSRTLYIAGPDKVIRKVAGGGVAVTLAPRQQRLNRNLRSLTEFFATDRCSCLPAFLLPVALSYISGNSVRGLCKGCIWMPKPSTDFILYYIYMYTHTHTYEALVPVALTGSKVSNPFFPPMTQTTFMVQASRSVAFASTNARCAIGAPSGSERFSIE